MNIKFVVKIGAKDSDVTLFETVPSLEKLIEARDARDAHKKAYFDCYQGQEVLSIKDTSTGLIVFTLDGGFVRS